MERNIEMDITATHRPDGSPLRCGNRRQFAEIIQKMTFGELMELSGEFIMSATDNDTGFGLEKPESWAWLLFGISESIIDNEENG